MIVSHSYGAHEGKNVRTSYNAPTCAGWTAAIPLDYPDKQED